MSADEVKIRNGAKLRAARLERDLPVSAFAELVRDVAPEVVRRRLPKLADIERTIRGHEAGAHAIGERYRLLYARALGMDEGELFERISADIRRSQRQLSSVKANLISDNPRNILLTSGEEDQDMERRKLLESLLVLGISVSPASHALESIRTKVSRSLGAHSWNVEDWEETALEYGYSYMVRPPQEFIADLAVDLVDLRFIMSDVEKDSPAYRDWCRIGTALSGLMAKTLSNAGHAREARNWWYTAVAASDMSGDLEARLWVRGERIMHGLYEKRPVPILLRQIEEATQLGAAFLCHGLASVSTIRAQVLVLTADTEAAEKELGHTADIFEALPSRVSEDQHSVHGWSEHRLRYTEAWVYAHAGNVAKTDSAAERALHLYAPGDYRTPAQVKLIQALAHTKAGDVRQGVAHAHAAYEVLPREQRTSLITDLAERVLQPIPLEARREEAIATYRDLVGMPGPNHDG